MSDEKRDDGGPAFPRPWGSNGAKYTDQVQRNGPQDGMSLRDYFAGQAMAAIIVAGKHDSTESIVFGAYYAADAMLRERAK